MKKTAILASAFCAALAIQSAVFAAEKPNCVLMKFSDDTRFVKVESAATISDMVLEKLLNSGKFNFKETKVVNQDIEHLLYDERAQELQNAKNAMEWGDYNTLFEGPGFNEKKAQSLASAKVGQFVTPGITSGIGQANGAEYLIQGTILNLGLGNWMDGNVALAQAIVTSVAPQAMASLMGSLGPLGGLLSGFNQKVTGCAVQADLRLIKASTGEVIWHKQVTGKDTQKQTSLGGGIIKIGSDKVNENMYYKAMDKTAQLICDALVADADAGKLFVK